MKEILLWVNGFKNPHSEFVKNTQYGLRDLDPKKTTVIWIETFEEFKGWISRNGMPDTISISNSVNNHDVLTIPSDKIGFDRNKEDIKFEAKLGKDFIYWLHGVCIRNHIMIPKLHVHGFTLFDQELSKVCKNLEKFYRRNYYEKNKSGKLQAKCI